MSLLRTANKSMETTFERVHPLVALKTRSVQRHVKRILSHWISSSLLINLKAICMTVALLQILKPDPVHQYYSPP